MSLSSNSPCLRFALNGLRNRYSFGSSRSLPTVIAKFFMVVREAVRD